jgi:hypothetical protein
MHLCTCDPVRNDFLCVQIHYLGKWNGTRLSAQCNSTGPIKLSISRAQPSPTCPRNGSARIENHYAHGTYKSEVQRWFYVQEPTGDLKRL